MPSPCSETRPLMQANENVEEQRRKKKTKIISFVVFVCGFGFMIPGIALIVLHLNNVPFHNFGIFLTFISGSLMLNGLSNYICVACCKAPMYDGHGQSRQTAVPPYRGSRNISINDNSQLSGEEDHNTPPPSYSEAVEVGKYIPVCIGIESSEEGCSPPPAYESVMR